MTPSNFEIWSVNLHAYLFGKSVLSNLSLGGGLKGTSEGKLKNFSVAVDPKGVGFPKSL